MPASIFSETELARLASFPEEIPGDDLIRAFTLTGADRDLVASRRGGSKPLGARASALCTSLPRLRSAPFERSSAIGRLLAAERQNSHNRLRFFFVRWCWGNDVFGNAGAINSRKAKVPSLVSY